MPKTIEYPRTSYLSAWEVAEVVDDFGGKCSIEACAKKQNRKVSGSFKAILGSAVKFGLLISKREMLTTTNLYRRIKHAYDKSEEKIYHREAFLHPPLFSHICRKFRNRELPVHMFDVMLVREFGVEEINAQNVAKAFVDGARMVDILDERNVIADIDKLAQATPRRDMASPEMNLNIFGAKEPPARGISAEQPLVPLTTAAPINTPPYTDDAITSLFGLGGASVRESHEGSLLPTDTGYQSAASAPPAPAGYIPPASVVPSAAAVSAATAPKPGSDQTATPPPRQFLPSSVAAASAVHNTADVYAIHITGPGIDTQLSVYDADDLVIVQALLDKIRKRLQSNT